MVVCGTALLFNPRKELLPEGLPEGEGWIEEIFYSQPVNKCFIILMSILYKCFIIIIPTTRIVVV